MKLFLIAMLSLVSTSVFAKCITLDLLAYETICKDGDCITPAVSPTPRKIQLSSGITSGYFYKREIAQNSDPNLTVSILGTISIEDNGHSSYNLKIGSQYYSIDRGTFGEVYADRLIVTDITSFYGLEIYGDYFFAADGTMYKPSVGVYPSKVDLCK